MNISPIIVVIIWPLNNLLFWKGTKNAYSASRNFFGSVAFVG